MCGRWELNEMFRRSQVKRVNNSKCKIFKILVIDSINICDNSSTNIFLPLSEITFKN